MRVRIGVQREEALLAHDPPADRTDARLAAVQHRAERFEAAQHDGGEGSLVDRFELLGERLFGIIREDVLRHETPDERREVRREERNTIVVLLIHDDHRGLALRSALPVVEHELAVPRRRSIGEAHADLGIPPLGLHEWRPEITEQRPRRGTTDRVQPGHGHVILRPDVHALRGEAVAAERSAVPRAAQLHVRGGQPVPELRLDFGDELVARSGLRVLLAPVRGIVEEIGELARAEDRHARQSATPQA